jgi:hypothetical protein
LESLLFDGVIKQRKIRHSNGQDYAYSPMETGAR